METVQFSFCNISYKRDPYGSKGGQDTAHRSSYLSPITFDQSFLRAHPSWWRTARELTLLSSIVLSRLSRHNGKQSNRGERSRPGPSRPESQRGRDKRE
jgi:hypothetical protein